MAQEVERSYSALETYVGENVELHVGTYTMGQQLLVVAAAEIDKSGAGGQRLGQYGLVADSTR
jgi:hypothetical protein